MSKIQITVMHTIDCEGDKCTESCLMTNCSDEYENHYYDWEVDNEIVCAVHGQEINIELSNDPEYKYTAIRCQACRDAERKADEDEAFITAQDSTMGGLIEDLTDAIQENDELTKALDLSTCHLGMICKNDDVATYKLIGDNNKILAKHKETKG